MAALHPKSFISLDGADHLLLRIDDASYAADVIAAWASRYMSAGRLPLRSANQPGVVVVEETGANDFQVEISAGAAHFLADEPVEVGGGGSGPTPYDLLAAGLGACTAMTLRMYARAKGLPLERVGVTVGHGREAGGQPPDLFSRSVRLTGDLSEAQRTRLMEIADRCPVHRTLEGGARIATVADDSPPQREPASPAQHVADATAAVSESLSG
jgi:putative redox protein